MGTIPATDWEAGVRCEKHDLAYCSDCLDQAKMKRASDGTVRFKSDCAVLAYMEITGSSYDESLSALRKVGYAPGRGTPSDTITTAFTDAGFRVLDVTRRYDLSSLPSISATDGSAFLVIAAKGSKGHAWPITDGKANGNPYQPPFRYQAFEVIA